MRDKGVINTYNFLKGFGFIRRKKGKDVFFFFDNFVEDRPNILLGDIVEFDVISALKGPRAYNISILGIGNDLP